MQFINVVYIGNNSLWFFLAEFLIRVVFIFNFASSAVISGNFFSCTIFCITVSLIFFSKCSGYLLLKDTWFFLTYITKGVFSSLHLKTVVYFQTEDRKRTVTTNRSTTSSPWRNMQWHDYLPFSLSMIYQNRSKFVGCVHRISSCILYDNFFWIYSLHFNFYRFIYTENYRLKNHKTMKRS